MNKCSLGSKRDRISYLPDPIRSRIISFLPMKEAMRTSILSRRWEHICSSLSNLEFHQCDFSGKKNKVDDFKSFVDELIFRHDGSDIQRFSLRIKSCDASLSFRRVYAWISFAVRHNVQDFELFMPVRKGNPEKLDKLPLGLFVCKTLTRLSLVDVKLECPTNIKFPVLKSFTCESISFHGDNSINKLMSGVEFPVLEELVLIWCFLNVKTISISIPTLKCFKILEGNYTEISISSSALKEIDYWGPDPPKISSESLSSLSCARFQFAHYFESEDEVARYSNFNCASKFLMGLQNVVRLHLMGGFLEFLSKDGDLLASLPSWCRSPKHLILEMLGNGVHNQVITLLLESFCNLEIVEIYVGGDYEENGISSTIKMESHCQKKVLPPVDIFNHLRTVTVKNFAGGMPELDMLRYFIDNAKVLEEMKIVSSQEKDKVAERPMTGEMLSIFSKISPNVSVSVS